MSEKEYETYHVQYGVNMVHGFDTVKIWYKVVNTAISNSYLLLNFGFQKIEALLVSDTQPFV